jgi:hypothetical protein
MSQEPIRPEPTKFDTNLRKVWNVFFLFLYPSLALFGLLYAGMIYVFSGISRVLFWLFSLVKKK